MNLLTLTLVALYLVSGALASRQILTKEVDGNGDVTLTCSNFNPPMKFMNNFITINNNPPHVVVNATEGTMTILAAVVGAMTGNYRCQNTGPGAFSDPGLDVGGAVKPLLTYVKDDTKFTFTCASVTVNATYTFYKSSAMVTPIDGVTINEGEMVILSDKFQGYCCEYTCKAKLDVDTESDVVELVEKPTLAISNDATNAVLTCKSNTAGIDEYNFRKDGETSDATAGVSKVAGTYTRTHAEVQAVKGTYTCYAKKSGKDSLNSDPQEFDSPFKPTITKTDGAETTSLKCETQTTDTTFKFYNEDVEVTGNADVTLNNDTLEIDTAKLGIYKGSYTCEAVIGSVTKKSDAVKVESSAPRLLTSGLALCLCLLVSGFL